MEKPPKKTMAPSPGIDGALCVKSCYDRQHQHKRWH